MTQVLITGADGFLGQNLRLKLQEYPGVQVQSYTRNHSLDELSAFLRDADIVFHLAGVNRPTEASEFQLGNVDLTRQLAHAVTRVADELGKSVPVVYASSTQAELANPYGASKRAAEEVLFELAVQKAIPVYVFRLPNVFGKWCRPDYNSVVATFCYKLARDLPIQVNDSDAPLTLVHVDDVLTQFVDVMKGNLPAPQVGEFVKPSPQYQTTVGALAELLRSFRESRTTLMSDRVGQGPTRALYATYVSYLPVEAFSYAVPSHRDARGDFVEMLKTPDCGQFSFLTAHPGVTRGGHYHHSKTEKFLVIRGEARFRFRHLQTGQTHELMSSGNIPTVVETVPGWTHDITNVGADELVVMLWANEVYDRTRPDTFSCPV